MLKHPSVIEASVFGIPHPRLQEEPAAVARVKPGSNISGEQIREFLKGRIASFKVPVFVRVQEGEIVATASGKALKRRLREEVAREREEWERKNGKAKL